MGMGKFLRERDGDRGNLIWMGWDGNNFIYRVTLYSLGVNSAGHIILWNRLPLRDMINLEAYRGCILGLPM